MRLSRARLADQQDRLGAGHVVALILSILGEYLERWPELSAEASFTDRITDIVEEGFDVAIRFGAAPVSSNLIA